MDWLEYHLQASGYTMKTTFWQDFTIAEKYGFDSVKDTFNRAFNEWKSNVEYLTELVLVLNWKLWYWYEFKNIPLSKLYNEFWGQADSYAMDNLNENDLSYFLKTTD